MKIDLNSDLGERLADDSSDLDEQMFKIVTSGNIACGLHAGDPASIRQTLALAKAYKTNVGAHVSYDDREGFGRREVDVELTDLSAVVTYQIGALDALARSAGTRVRYVKPHGALYNSIAYNESRAHAVINAIIQFNPELPLVCLAGSPLIGQARAAGLLTISEAFADRAYNPSGELVSRSQPFAVITDGKKIAERMVRLVTTGKIDAIDGTQLQMDVDTICVHGDTSGSVEIASHLQNRLRESNVQIIPFMENA